MARTRVSLKREWRRDSRHGSNLEDLAMEIDWGQLKKIPEDEMASVITLPKKKEVNRVEEFWRIRIEEEKNEIQTKKESVNRLTVGRNELNLKVKEIRAELEALKEHACHVGDVVKVIKDGEKTMCYVKVMHEKVVVDLSHEVNVMDLVPGARVALRASSLEVLRILPTAVDPGVAMMLLETSPDVTYDMLGGIDKQIQEVKEVIELPIKHPELFESLGIQQPKGVILYGPPGTGKTLLARAVAHHTSCRFIRVAGTELVQKYIGEGARMVREIFLLARNHAPAIIFMDEIDSVGSARMEQGNSEVQRTMLELLNQLDGFEASNNIKVIMATNRLDIMDEALLRPGRIDRKIELPPPNEDGRLDILRIHSSKMNLMRGINLRAVVEKTKGACGAEVKNLCTEAGMLALRERRSHVTQEDFDLAVAKVMKKLESEDMSIVRLWK